MNNKFLEFTPNIMYEIKFWKPKLHSVYTILGYSQWIVTWVIELKSVPILTTSYHLANMQVQLISGLHTLHGNAENKHTFINQLIQYL